MRIRRHGNEDGSDMMRDTDKAKDEYSRYEDKHRKVPRILRRRHNIVLPEDTYILLKKEADKELRSMSSIVTECINDKLK